MGKMLKAIVAKPGKGPQVTAVENSLEALQSIVCGYIQCVPLSEKATLVCNEEGKLLGWPFNRALVYKGVAYDVVLGPFLIVGADEDEFVSLTRDQITDFLSRFGELRSLSDPEKNVFPCFDVGGDYGC